MSVALQRIVADVVGAAEADPEGAPEIYAGAADEFRAHARRRENARIAGMLAARANEFEALAFALAQRRTTRATVDDFAEQEAEHAQAHAEVGHLDDLEIRARRDQIHEERHGRDHVLITPESVSEKTALGRQTKVRFAPTEAERITQVFESDTVVLWQGRKVEAQDFTVDVGVTEVPPLGTTVSCRPYGIVTYGSDGFQMSFRFDVGLGVRFTGVGNYCSVLVGMGAPRSGTVSGTMSIGASLGFFAAPSVAPVILTSYVEDITVGTASAPILRPSRAQFLLPPQSSDITGATRLDFLDYSSAVISSLAFANGTVISPIPITGEIAAVVVNATTGVGSVRTRLPWQLST